jgi:ABC-type nitrate/sulfonate/bicarbonate transport system substrate-binding protein
LFLVNFTLDLHIIHQVSNATEISSLVAMQSWIDRNPETAIACRQAIVRAAEFANTHDRETRNILGRYVSLTQNILDVVVLPQFIAGSLNELLLDETILRMRQAGWLKSQFSAGDLIAKF